MWCLFTGKLTHNVRERLKLYDIYLIDDSQRLLSKSIMKFYTRINYQSSRFQFEENSANILLQKSSLPKTYSQIMIAETLSDTFLLHITYLFFVTIRHRYRKKFSLQRISSFDEGER